MKDGLGELGREGALESASFRSSRAPSMWPFGVRCVELDLGRTDLSLSMPLSVSGYMEGQEPHEPSLVRF
jgi:hypothetical protein